MASTTTSPVIHQTTTTAAIVSQVAVLLSIGRTVRLGRWIMLPAGRVFRLPEEYRSGRALPEYFDEYEVAVYEPAGFVDAWRRDW